MSILDKELKRQAKFLKMFCFYFALGFCATSCYDIVQDISIVSQLRASAIGGAIIPTIIYFYLHIKDSFFKEESNDGVKHD